jgi:hypothetical protein
MQVLGDGEQMGQKSAVEQDVCGFRVQSAEARVIVEADQMIHIGRDYEPVFILTKFSRQSDEFFDAVVIESDRQWHNGEWLLQPLFELNADSNSTDICLP